MFKTVVFDSENDWLSGRAKTVGSSEIAALCGMGYASQSPYQLWASKTGKVQQVFDDEAKIRLEAGHLAEPLARFMFQAKSGKPCYYDEAKTIRTNDAYPAFAASLDAWTRDDDDQMIPVELKLISPRDLWQYQEDILPEKFTLQLQVQMAVIEASKGFLVVVCGTEVVIREVPRHDRMIAAMHAIAVDFLQKVADNVPPAIDGSDATADTLKRQWPEMLPGQICELGSEFTGLAKRRDKLKALEKRASELSQKIDSTIKAEMCDAEYAIDPDGNCFSWRNGARARTFLRLNSVPPAVRIFRASRQESASA